MKSVRQVPGFTASVFSVVVFIAASCSSSEAAPAKGPATAEEAAKVIDLANFPLMDGAEVPSERTLARLGYEVKGGVKDVFEAQRKLLLERQWTEAPNSYVSDETASATFTRDGFALSLSVYSPGKPGVASVSLSNHGNVALDKVPVPEGAAPLYSFPVTAAYVTEASPKETVEACRKLLAAAGWMPYGQAGDTYSFKQNAIQLQVSISAAPAQGNKTAIQFTSNLLSVDLPAPADADKLHYSDSPTQIAFDHKSSIDDVAKYYRETLAKSQWQATTDKPIKIDFRHELIFRNPAKDMLTLEMHTVDGITRVLLRHQTAELVAEIEKRAKAEIERRKMEKNKPLPKVVVSVPADATDVETTKSRIEFKTTTGAGKKAVDMLRKQLAKDGWKEKVNADDVGAGSITFSRKEQSLDLLYVDPGFIPAEITLSASGVELTTESEKK